MQRARQLLEVKGRAVYTIAADAALRVAIECMADKNVGALLVMRDNELVGMVLERDCARALIAQDPRSADAEVASVMRDVPARVSPDTSVAECLRLCVNHDVHHLPVVDGSRVIGMLSVGDLVNAVMDVAGENYGNVVWRVSTGALVKAVLDSQAEEIDRLQRYIAGWG